MSPEFKEYVNQLVIAHRDERIYPFQYEGKKFWLKQPEKLKGIWLLLKPYPKQSFKNELQTLLNLAEKNAPVPIVSYHDEDFFVLESHFGFVLSFFRRYFINRSINRLQTAVIFTA